MRHLEIVIGYVLMSFLMMTDMRWLDGMVAKQYPYFTCFGLRISCESCCSWVSTKYSHSFTLIRTLCPWKVIFKLVG